MTSTKKQRTDVYTQVTLWARRLGRHYILILLLAVALTAVSSLITSRLRFNSDLADLLPEDHPDLQILRRIQAKYATDTGFMVLLSKNYVFVADEAGTIHMHNGRSWIRTPTGASLHALWGFAADDVFAAGDGGRVLRFDGTRWRTMKTGVRVTLRGLWGDSPDNLYAVGDRGTIIRFDGKRWSAVESPSKQNLRAISGNASSVFAVGDSGTILFFDGRRFIVEAAGSHPDLSAVWVGRKETLAVGRGGTFLRRKEGLWSPLATKTRQHLTGVWGSRDGNVQAVGDEGIVLHYDGRRIAPQESSTRASLTGIHGVRHDDVWAIGDGCTVMRWDWKWYPGPFDFNEKEARDARRRWWDWASAREPEQSCSGRFTAIWRPTADLAAAERIAPALASRLEKDPEVSRVDFKKPVQFFWDRALLFSSVKDLERLRDRIEENLERETAKGTGLYVDLEQDRSKKSKKDLSRLYSKYRKLARSFGTSEWYVHPDGASLGLLVYPKTMLSDFESLRRLRAKIEGIIAKIAPESHDPLLRIDVGGDAVAKIREYDATVNDVFGKAWIAVLGIILLMLLYFRRLVGLLFVALPLGMSISWTFALTTLSIGTLNAVTGFLFAVLFGLGIDYGLQLYARYREGRRAGLSPDAAMNHVVLDTGRATLTSALTTAAALLTLTVTDFKGFSEFGFIAGIGVLLALISFILVMPAMIFLAERLELLRFPVSRATAHLEDRAPGQEPFRLPRTVLIASALVLAYGIFGATGIRFEYDNRKLRPVLPKDEIQRRCGQTLGRAFTPTLLLADSRRELEAATDAIRREIDRLGPRSAVKNVLTILDLVPRRQHEKRVILEELEQLLHEKRWDLVSDAAKERIGLDSLRKMARAKPFALDDLPGAVRRKFKGPGFGGIWLALVFHSVDLGHTKQARILKRQVGSFEGSRWINLTPLLPGGATALCEGRRAEIRCPAGDTRCIASVIDRMKRLRHGGQPVFMHVEQRRDAYRKHLAVIGGLRGEVFVQTRPGYLLRAGEDGPVVLRSGTFHVSSGELVLSEVVEVLLHDGRIAFLLALSAIFIASLVDFRSLRSAALACLPLVVGLFWTFGVMHLIQLRLNLFNFVILPALLGIGIDYGVHYVHRYHSEGVGNLGRVMRSLYWVIFFCAATTIVGFGNMALATHPGLKSLGQLAIIGMACMFFASTYTLPSALYVLERLQGIPLAAVPSRPHDVVVYATSYCPSCRLVRRLLSDRSVPFTYVELDTLSIRERRNLAASIVAETGADTLPVTRVAGRFVVGFNPSELMRAVELREVEAAKAAATKAMDGSGTS